MPSAPNIVVVMPAYNAESTLHKTVSDIPKGLVSEIILCDDHSRDRTVEIARSLGLRVLVHDRNRGYGANQKTCYEAALRTGAEIVAMIHPDYQYDPRVLPAAVQFIDLGICDVVIGSRVRTRAETLKGGMPLYKYLCNRLLTAVENTVFGQNLGDFHSGFRVYRRAVLERIDYKTNSDDFIFDTEFLAQAAWLGFRIGDVPVPTRYMAEASSINFSRSVKYGLGCLAVSGKFALQKAGLARFHLFQDNTQTTPSPGA
jgi:glycosyltransferase involved in cell wall biosynthesis